ncbi:MAG TPA: hypothetical protein PLV21_07695 [Cyclobacteriaceae bacterium]|nr:hypothetical protein [Cyclobacteriaceae bacterium]HRJ81748.1 hypothetical protein [Cyclobacteriaceae bacterium]
MNYFKTAFVFSFMTIFPSLVVAQIQHGKVLLSGTINYVNPGGDSETSHEVGLSLGYFFSNKAMIGLSVSGSRANGYDFGLGLFGDVRTTIASFVQRNYIRLGDEAKAYFFIQPGVNYLKLRGTDIFTGTQIEDQTTFISLSPGFAFYPAKWVGFEFTMTGLIYEFGGGDNESSFAVDINPLSPSIGITFLLGKD